MATINGTDNDDIITPNISSTGETSTPVDDLINGLGGNDLLAGGDGNDTLEGGDGDDQLLGGRNYDYLYGGAGNDVLDGSRGEDYSNDYLVGGTGDDIYYAYSWETPIVELPREGVDTINSTNSRITLPDNIENLNLDWGYNGSQGSGNALDNIITGDQYQNQLMGLGGSDTLIGNAGNDTLIGDGEGADTGEISLYNIAKGVDGLQLLGESSGSYAGGSFSALGDVNGDGKNDIAIGASGKVHVAFGDFGDDWQLKLADLPAQGLGFNIVGSGNEWPGGILASAGDVNNDGLNDILVSNYGDSEGGGSYAGAAYVVFGKTDNNEVDLSAVANGQGGFKIIGENGGGYYYGDWAGYSLDSLGDINADGYGDLLIGARGNDEGGWNAGAAYLVYGKAGGDKVDLADVARGIGGYKIVGENGHPTHSDGAGDYTGTSVANAGDVNQDGITDLLIGAPQAGAAYLVYGKTGGNTINLDDIANGIGGIKLSGGQVSAVAAGDINGDGHQDIIIGGSGQSYVIFGGLTSGNYDLSQVGDSLPGFKLYFSGGLDVLGDVNGDGRDDLLFGNFSVLQSSLYGTAVVYGKQSNAPVSADEIRSGIGGFGISVEQYHAFSAVSAAGDVTGDGVPDILAGTTYNDNNRGVAYVIDGYQAVHFRGDDILEGGEGNDNLAGGGGNDALNGGVDTDTADYSSSRGAVLADLSTGFATQDGWGGHDTLTDIENLKGSGHNDKLRGNDGPNALHGQDGDDQLIGNGGTDTLDGGYGNDLLDGGTGNDTLTGGYDADRFILSIGMGEDTLTDFERGKDQLVLVGLSGTIPDWNALQTLISYSGGKAVIDLGSGERLTLNNMPANTLTESDFQGIGSQGERWFGTPAADTHTGTAYDDLLDGLADNDILHGGAGDDLIVGDSGGDTGDDQLYGDSGDDVLEGNAGNDLLDGGEGNDTVDYSRALGSVGVDLSQGLVSDDGDLGQDILHSIENVMGSPQADYVIGSDLDNQLYGKAGHDVLKGLGGNDLLSGGDGNDTLEGGEGDDRLLGGRNYDYLYGGAGNDVLDGSRGEDYSNDYLAGGTGDDIYYAYSWETPIVELPREGVDTINSTNSRITLPDNIENLNLDWGYNGSQGSGNALDNIITGDQYQNQLMGLGGSDTLIGNSGNDTLIGDGEVADTGAVSLYNVARGVGGLQLFGDQSYEYAGGALAGLGDVNGDGQNDFAISASYHDQGGSDAGAIYVIYGVSANDWQLNLADLAPQGRALKLMGEQVGDYAGYGAALLGLGDLNHDGLDDFAVSAQHNDAGGVNAGAVYVVFGRSGSGELSLTEIANGQGGYKIIGENAADYAGSVIKSAGDVNNDGLTDLLIGASGNDEGGPDGTGAAYVVYGKANTTAINLDEVANGIGGFKIVGENNVAGQGTGSTLTAIGDVNGDGRNDLLIGAAANRPSNFTYPGGAVYVVYSPADGSKIDLSAVAQGQGGFKVSGEYSAHYIGNTLTSADVNGDGEQDLIIGASGVTYVVFGHDQLAPFNLSEVGVSVPGYQLQFGGGVENIGDLNGDGRDDLIVSNFSGQSWNRTAVVYGKASQAPVTVAQIISGIGGFVISNEVDANLSAAAGAGDLDGDAIPDLLIGQTLFSKGSTNYTGTGYVVFGNDALQVRGNDLLEGGEGDDNLVGGGGNDALNGGVGNDLLNGGSGDDTLNPGTGTDQVDGGEGIDRMVLDWSGATVSNLNEGIITDLFDANGDLVDDPTQAVERVMRTQGNNPQTAAVRNVEIFTLTGTQANDVLVGGALADSLSGGHGNDTLLGFSGDDVLEGGDGDDELSGGLGTDTQTGGAGADHFKGSLSELNGDTITDFTDNDRITLQGLRIDSNALSFANGVLAIDSDADGTADAELHLQGYFYGQFQATPSDLGNDASTEIRFIRELPTISISALDANKTEPSYGVSQFTFTVSKSGDISQASSVDYSVVGVGKYPTSWNDFVGSTNGIVTFQPGENNKIISINIANNLEIEPTENFTVNLSNSINTQIVLNNPVATISQESLIDSAGLCCINPRISKFPLTPNPLDGFRV